MTNVIINMHTHNSKLSANSHRVQDEKYILAVQ